ncbi:related to tRNA (uracil-O(2)-)-methyltransferase [Phialocephala subalpina]|uniref:tRNA (uracil-O(2)-)-methyltransferase n=1 Tax=Phialocephala subalpina TaxID=576137 RepID=A0A1L7WGB8_9HELO|nr:related to tRNA (uracil-O(2)-)-methyltransferase [Phialocephala subalpina]
MGFSPESTPVGAVPNLEETSGKIWTPLYSHNCSFPPEIFRQVMLNLIRNPNINSNHLFRADISLDRPSDDAFLDTSDIPARITHFTNFDLKTIMVRTMIPRNMLVDKPLDQTCLFHHQEKDSGEIHSLVTYLPHILKASESPFYHPAVHGIGFLHTFQPSTNEGTISIHYRFFESEPRSKKLERTAQHLLAVLYKHGQGCASGYVKRVHHDLILPQATVQNTYSRLKAKYARKLVEGWVEATDPAKHVFEDLGIAAFLIELWAEMFKEQDFPGFVDIGCGNGLLVHVLLEEGYTGWGFDARKRKSWSTFSQKAQNNLREMVLIPSILSTNSSLIQTSHHSPTQSKAQGDSSSHPLPALLETLNLNSTTKEIHDVGIQHDQPPETLNPNNTTKEIHDLGIQDGRFPKGTFIISNHADELTPWTPILATLSECPFMMIPCCSHALSGARFRAPSTNSSGPPSSAYASLVAWVAKLATDCGWDVEKEMLRIPSTRKCALIGRRRIEPFDSIDALTLIKANGGAAGWEESALKLVKGATRGH